MTSTPEDPANGLVSGSPLAGVALRPLVSNPDARGEFIEVFCDHWESGIEPAQWSVVHSRPGVFRGMHLHLRHEEYFTVISGRASVGLYDLRPRSPTEGASALYGLSGDDPAFLTFPAGTLHGWLFHEPTIHLQAVSEPYEVYADDDNLGCLWSDPALGIEWPHQPTIVSDRAQSFPSLAELRSRIRS